MDSSTPKPNVQALQDDVIPLLKNVGALMSRASDALSSDGSGDKYKVFQQEVEDATRNVEDLELRMAIVAPMKAGKSTIINAVVGQELLPSRNAAMTTLPTEIILDSTVSQPRLTLSQNFCKIFNETIISLKDRIRNLEDKDIKQKVSEHPHLSRLIEKIKKVEGKFPTSFVGHEKVIGNLKSINDIVRLCSLIDPLSNPLQVLDSFPRLHTSFWRSFTDEQSKPLGNLVIIDTPGPNEAGENLRLKEVVSRQLKSSSLVLLVLDFTQLKTEAAETIKREVDRVVRLRGKKDNLFILVNKIDQRRQGDMTTKQVQQFVAAEFGIGDVDNNKQVFEVSAIWAFCAAKFLQELEANPDTDVKDMTTVQPLLQELFPSDWQEELEYTDKVDLEKRARRLWKKSGFAPFLDKAVKDLMADAAPRCIKSALSVAHNHLLDLRDSIKLRNNAISKDADKLKSEVENLQQDLNDLQKCRQDLKGQIEAKKNSLKSDLNRKLNKLQKESSERLRDYFLHELMQRIESYDKQRTDNNVLQAIWTKIKQLDIELKKKLLSEVNVSFLGNYLDNISLYKSLSKIIEYEFVLRGRNKIEFKSKEEAREFAEQAFIEGKQIVEILLVKRFDEIQSKVQQYQNELSYFLDENTQGIIERARNRLNEEFSVNLSLPNLQLGEAVLNTKLSNLISSHEKNFGSSVPSMPKQQKKRERK